ncbi:MAG: hypothetical protein ACOZIN_06255 [Myxococcota bacterium]
MHGRDDRWGLSVALALAAVALGHALQVSNGNLHPESIVFLSSALVLCVAGVAAPKWERLERLGDAPVVFVLLAGVGYQLYRLLIAPPGIYLQVGPAAYVPFFGGLGVTAVLAGAGLSRQSPLGPLRVPTMLLVHLLLGVWLIRASPNPFIDVHVFQRDGVAALLAGQNPYAMTFPDIYGNSPFYGPGLSEGGRLKFGFPYPPLSLFLALPGQLFGGDHRYSQLLAMTGAGALMAYARPGRVAPAAAALFLFTPRAFFVLEQGWTEPFAVLLLASVVFAACRLPRALPWAFGLFLAVKQYLVLAIPLGFLLLPRPLPEKKELWRMGGQVVGIGLLVTLPLALWDVKAFLWDVVTLQTVQPFRAEALSYLAYFARQGGAPPPTALAFVVALLGVGLSLWRSPRTPGGFAASCALVLAGFFAFNKQAFCNYYYLVVGALCCAVAVAGPTYPLPTGEGVDRLRARREPSSS